MLYSSLKWFKHILTVYNQVITRFWIITITLVFLKFSFHFTSSIYSWILTWARGQKCLKSLEETENLVIKIILLNFYKSGFAFIIFLHLSYVAQWSRYFIFWTSPEVNHLNRREVNTCWWGHKHMFWDSSYNWTIVSELHGWSQNITWILVSVLVDRPMLWN